MRVASKLAAALAAATALAAFMAAAAVADPVVTVGSPEGITVHEERLVGTVEPTQGSVVTYSFEYFANSEFQYTPTGEIPKGTKGPVAVSAVIKGLSPGSLNYVRLVAFEWTPGPSEVAMTSWKYFYSLRGIYPTGEKSSEESKQPRFASTSYPRSLNADVPAEATFNLLRSNGESVPVVGCTSMPMSATLSAASSSLQLNPVSSLSTWKCNPISGQQVKVNTNGCYYTYSLANAGPPYTGGVEIGCKEPGENIEIIIGTSTPVCTVKIPAQAIESTVQYTESNYLGASAAVDINASGKAIHWEKTGILCSIIPGNGTAGTFSGHLLVH